MNKEDLVVKQLQELRTLETQLQRKWNGLKSTGKGVRTSFVASLRELQGRAQQLEQMLDSQQGTA